MVNNWRVNTSQTLKESPLANYPATTNRSVFVWNKELGDLVRREGKKKEKKKNSQKNNTG